MSTEEKVISMRELVIGKFLEHKMAVVSMMIVFSFSVVALLAPWIASALSIDPESQNPLARYLPAFSHTIVDSSQRAESLELWRDQNRDEVEPTLIALSLDSFDSLNDWFVQDWEIIEPQISKSLGNGDLPPRFRKLLLSIQDYHILGTDELGRDVFIRIIYGARVSMGVGLLVALAAALIGLMIGSLAGFHGGFLDTILMRITDSLLSLPQVPVLIVMAAIDLNKVPLLTSFITQGNQSIVKMVLILCLFSWMQVARLVRANVLSLREREFVLAARTLGAKDYQLILWHLLPNVIAPMLVAVTLGIGNAILFESILSFLGLGIQPPTPSWGNMLFNAQEIVSEAPLLAVVPGLMILTTIVCFNYLGDGLQDALDPKALKR